MRRVRRSDGRVFKSIAEAIRITYREQFGYPCPKVESFQPHISAICRGKHGCKNALGYSWEYADEPTKTDLQKELLVARAKLELANKRLKSNGLEVVA
jgi:hypothetical protein